MGLELETDSPDQIVIVDGQVAQEILITEDILELSAPLSTAVETTGDSSLVSIINEGETQQEIIDTEEWVSLPSSLTPITIEQVQGLQGEIGPEGPKGDKGDQGVQGVIGPTGPAPNLIGVNTTLTDPTGSASGSITGTNPNYTINVTIPRGAQILTGTANPAAGTGMIGYWYLNNTTWDIFEKTGAATWTLRGNIKGAKGDLGNTGATGPANSLTIGTVSASAPGSAPSATIGGAAPNQTISFVLPRGDTGPTGPAPTLTIGTVSTGAAGSSVSASFTGSNPYALNLTIPRGDKGDVGSQWYYGSGAPSAGTGVNGDFYLVASGTGIGDVYKKVTGAWTLSGNIRGAAGTGDVNSVNSVLPDASGNVTIAIPATYADLTGTVPASALPPLAINEVFTVASQAAMLALTAQRGDMAIRTDISETFVLATDSPGTLADWKQLSSGGKVTSVNGYIGTVVLTKADLGLANVPNVDTTNASNIITGTLADARLPVRLSGVVNASTGNVSSADSVATTGWNYLNPATELGAGISDAVLFTVVYSSGYAAQTAYSLNTAQGNRTWRRTKSGGTWTAWTEIYDSTTSDARYAMLTGAQTIAGIKTFSSSPVVPDGSWTITKTTGLQGALDAKANASHVHDTAAITTGTFDIARIPTGTTSTTVALGNHLHTGVYEPVITTGTTSQFYRGDKQWATLDKAAVGLSNINNVAQVEIAGAQTITGVKTFTSGPVVSHYVVGVQDSLILKNTYSSGGVAGPGIVFSGYYKHGNIYTSQDPAAQTGGDMYLRTWANDTTQTLGIKIAKNGPIGLNTHAPSLAAVTVASNAAVTTPTLGSSTNASLLITNNDSNYGLLFGVGSGGQPWMQAQRVDSATGGPATAYNMYIQPVGGNVAIGGTTATERLEVTGNIKASGTITATSFIGSGAGITGILPTALPDAALGDNVVLNGDFSSVEANGVPTGWGVASGMTVSRTTVGEAYVMNFFDTTASRDFYMSTPQGRVYVRPGEKFHASIGASSVGGGHVFTVVMHQYDRGGGYLASSSFVGTTSNGSATFAKYSTGILTVTTSADVSYVRFGLQMQTANVNYGFEKFRVTRVGWVNNFGGQVINWNSTGVGAPTTNGVRSVGSRLVLWDDLASNGADYAIGIDSSTQWYSIPVASSSQFFKWYAGSTNVMTLTGAGAFNTLGAITQNGTAVVLTNDSRLADARTPTAHTHTATDITSGTIAPDRLGSGTPDSTKFLRGDGTWTPPAGGGAWETIADVAVTGGAASTTINFTADLYKRLRVSTAVNQRTSGAGVVSMKVTGASTTPTAYVWGAALPTSTSATSGSSNAWQLNSTNLATSARFTLSAEIHLGTSEFTMFGSLADSNGNPRTDFWGSVSRSNPPTGVTLNWPTSVQAGYVVLEGIRA